MCRILVAEDSPVNLHLIKAIFKNRPDVQMVTVSNGADAVEKACDETFDMVLMDVQMPIMNGVEATRLIRECGRDMPIVALTANPMAKKDCIEAGFSGFLTKPIGPNELLSTLREYVPLVEDANA